MSGDHRTFSITPNDKDSHNPILIHVTPTDLTRQERQTYIPGDSIWPGRNVERRSRRPTRGSRLSHLIMEDTMVSTQHHRHHGDQRTDECILLREEDNTKRFFCTVF